MATIRKRSGKWQARIQRTGYLTQTKTFNSKQDAEVWARGVESKIDLGTVLINIKKNKISLGELLLRYKDDITPRKKGAQIEIIRINRILRDEKICKYQSSALTSEHIAEYRDHRLEKVSPTTVRLELALFSHLFNTAIKEWGIKIDNPVALIQLPKANKARNRRLGLPRFQ
jgi:hypothetical protein